MLSNLFLEFIVSYQKFKGKLRLFDRELFLLVVAVGSEGYAWSESSSAISPLHLDPVRIWGRSKVGKEA